MQLQERALKCREEILEVLKKHGFKLVPTIKVNEFGIVPDVNLAEISPEAKDQQENSPVITPEITKP